MGSLIYMILGEIRIFMGSLIYLTKFPEFDVVPYSHDFLRINFVMFLHCKTLKKCDFFSGALRAPVGSLIFMIFGKSEFLWGPLLTPPNLAEFGMGSLIEGGLYLQHGGNCLLVPNGPTFGNPGIVGEFLMCRA